MFSKKKLSSFLDKAKEKASELQNIQLPGIEEFGNQMSGVSNVEPDLKEHPHLPMIEYQTLVHQLQIDHET